MIDIHNHVLIGVDDGPKTEADAVSLLEQAIEQGITDVIATPHHYSGDWRTPSHVVDEKLRELKSIAEKYNLNINIHRGQEIRVNGDIIKELKSGDNISLNDSQYILIEFPFGDLPLYSEKLFFDLQIQGYIPLIAHPERCMPLLRNPSKLYEIVQKGAISQLTASSITGGHGESVKNKSLKFIENNLAHVIASDAHNANFRPFELKEAYEIVAKELGEEYVERLQKNAESILNNRDIDYLEPVEVKRESGQASKSKKRKKLFGLF